MSSVTVIHLVRKANGHEALNAFLRAYNAHPAGIEHDLAFAAKGFPSDYEDDQLHSQWMNYPDTGYDIGTYRRAAEDVGTEYVCFLNSWSRPLVDEWLWLLMHAARDREIGLVGCSGSEEISTHIRTNAFCMRRSLFLEIAPKDPTREECLSFEHGPNSLTKQVFGLKLDAVVVGARGATHEWRDSNTFRWGNQCDLLVADNRTDAFANADQQTKDWLQRLAWGCTEHE